jgi:uncharacterized membrane protein affecting hemolysin expression
MNATYKNDKQARFKLFLQRLSEDKDVRSGSGTPVRSLSELLLFAGYTPSGESVDVSRLLTLLLHEQGVEGCSEQLIEHVLSGGTIEGFLNRL